MEANTGQVIKTALKKGFDGGTSGAAAMAIQVSSLMWIRTTMNYQYRYGTSTTQAFKKLWTEGGLRRLYRGVGPALLQGPLSRFGDTAANVAILSLLEKSDLPVIVKSGTASLAAASWRIVIMPVDTLKTTLQVEGKDGLRLLGNKMRLQGPAVFWYGSLAAASATAVGHFPWFYTFNQLQAVIPQYSETYKKLARNALIGFCSSVVSDTVSNSLRVIKTTRQTYTTPISYIGVVREVVTKDGWIGLFGRGLKTRLIANGIQGLMFSVLWKYFMDLQEQNRKKTA
ncbi:uncharacterized protein LOC111696668 [Eurytemora carolleeae]|uniref:uncharacterized protein LOC111696668 n=1 Tax=Eurytemora carolleeae TaxID=1294199 RepID=UPI000C770DC3|nr:uncharacterized protein LOC111696668 [Eurytemora carolleeae]|eukprot:XP_023322126.1 uncharacterized protein LOC111696668 [Eurytemora affinis]